ncbi:MAG TPA: SurA N-terminal domain-containing protein [Sphaerochaeta sp.]|nr:SurA N-terminal domain-containing protein [Sphaerochaeta sp.]
MSSDDKTDEKKGEGESKGLDFKKGKKSSTTEKEQKVVAVHSKRKITPGWIFGMIVLLLIAVSFVLAPAIQAFVGPKNADGIVFGKYGKEDIKYAYGNYFYDQVQNFGGQYKNTGDNATQTLYQVWKSAYDSTVLFTAVNQLASKAGLIAADEVVNRAIINSGAYNKDGKFDVELYQQATAENKASVEKSIRRSLPYQIVIDDIGSALSSSAEADYVAKLASEGRTFNYVDINASLYPDEKASVYALQNKQLFYSMDLSIISVETEDEAKTLSSAIANGEKSFEEAALSSSKDNYAVNEGKVGTVYYFGLTSNFKNPEDAAKLLTAKSGDIVGPVEGPGAWSIYRLDSTPLEADYASPALLSTVKAYLASSEDPVVDDYLLGLANDFVLDAKDDFSSAAEKANLDLVNVAGTPYNIAQSTYMNNFSNTDPQGKLARVVTTKELGKKLYTAELGSILEPIKSNASYLVVQADEEVSDDGMGSYLQMFYSYLSGSQNQQDFSQALYTSDKFEDNFLGTFFSTILGQG